MRTIKLEKLNPLIPSATVLLVSLILLVFAFKNDWDEIFVIFWLCFGLGVGLIYPFFRRDSDELRYILTLFVFAFSINVLTVIVTTSAFQADNYGDPFRHSTDFPFDDWRYHDTGIHFSNELINGGKLDLGSLEEEYSYIGYIYLLAHQYYLSEFFGGRSPVVPRIFNSLAGALIVILIYSIGKNIYGREVGRAAAIVALLFPAFWFYSAMTVRDILVSLLITAMILTVIKSTQGRGPGALLLYLAAFSALAFPLYYLRSPNLFVVVLGTALYIIIAKPFGNMRILYYSLFGVAIAAMFAWIIGPEGSEFERVSRYGESYVDLVDQEASSSSLAYRYIHLAPIPLNYILLIIFASFTPIPPFRQITIPGLIEGFGAVYWYVLIPSWVLGTVAAIKHKKAMYLVIMQMLMLVAIAVTTVNIRHKTQFYPIGIVMATAYFLAHRNKVKKLTTMYLGALAFLFLVYTLIKS